MNPANARVYVKFVDGVEVFIPVDAVLVSENIYQLLADNEFDYDDNAVLFEFGSHDVVKTHPVLATWVIRRLFGILGGNFRHAITLFRPAWACLFFEYTP